jgi:type I restriction enzyme R subunit
MSVKEATARIKINKLLESAGWRFFADAKGAVNIQLEPNVTVKTQDLDALGENFEKSSKGFPFIVLEVKTEQTLVTTNRELINRFEKKIQMTLARVWGENTAAPFGETA